MQLVSTRIPEVYVEKLNQLVEKNYYNCRSEAIRIAVRDFIILEFERIREEALNNPKNVKVIEIHDPIERKVIHILEKLT